MRFVLRGSIRSISDQTGSETLGGKMSYIGGCRLILVDINCWGLTTIIGGYNPPIPRLHIVARDLQSSQRNVSVQRTLEYSKVLGVYSHSY